jgi:hypothetical protein
MHKLENSREFINEIKAIELTNSFQSNNPKLNKVYFISSDIITEIIDYKNCKGIYTYNALPTKTQEYNRVLVDDNSKEECMFEGLLVDASLPYPENCSEKSSLMK